MRFSKNIVPEGYSTFEYLDFRVILDGKMFDHQVVTNINYDNLDLRIGYKTYGSFFQSDLGSVIDHFRFHGQIEMVSLSKMFGEDETILALCSKLEGISKTREYDELGMLKKVDIHKSGTSILSNTYLYKRSLALQVIVLLKTLET